MRIWDPFQELATLREEMNRAAAALRADGGVVRPAAHLSQDDGGYLLEIDMPGVRPDDLELDARGRTLQVRATRSEGGRQWRYEQAVTLPDPVDTAHVDAGLADGVLRVRIPTSEVGVTRIPVAATLPAGPAAEADEASEAEQITGDENPPVEA